MEGMDQDPMFTWCENLEFMILLEIDENLKDAG